jgi:hypothetical protein
LKKHAERMSSGKIKTILKYEPEGAQSLDIAWNRWNASVLQDLFRGLGIPITGRDDKRN